ncbi:MAG: hypothetical protein LJE70_07055 [Chromatiaceae bacterium]|nr:hypothetical protein [Chromatiaceae bacterium]
MERPLTITDRARRRFLISSLAGLLVGIGPCGRCIGSEKQDTPHELPWWFKLTGDRDAVLRFGDAYLRSHPEESQLSALVAEIEKPVPSDGELQEAATSEARSVGMLERRVRDDYRRGELVSVNGWLLSRTEARLYAAVALFYASGR